jgi:L-fuconolactonase
VTVVDAHQHFWDPAEGAYSWMTDEVAALRRPFGPEDLEPVLRAYGVTGTVVVQAEGTLDETRRLLAIGERTPFVLGVVGWVDLTDSRVDAVLAELRAAPGGHRLVGIRHQVHDEPDPDWLLRVDVQRGLAAVARAGLVYDLLVRSAELPAALRTARALPDLRLVVDHLAKPPLRGAGSEEWTRRLEQLARLPNVACKLSGLVTEADWVEWRCDELVPYLRRALEWFGPERSLFGSDWPVCLLAADYGAVLDLVRTAIAELSAAAQEAVLGDNAISLYGLEVVSGR